MPMVKLDNAANVLKYGVNVGIGGVVGKIALRPHAYNSCAYLLCRARIQILFGDIAAHLCIRECGNLLAQDAVILHGVEQCFGMKFIKLHTSRIIAQGKEQLLWVAL